MTIKNVITEESDGCSNDEVEAKGNESDRDSPRHVTMKDHSGVVAIIKASLFFDEVLGMESLSIGRGGLDRYECMLEMSGRFLSYEIYIDGGFIFVSTPQAMDLGEEREPLFSIPDTKEKWPIVCRFVQSLERSRITSLKERPIEIGEGGKDSWLIS